jgi:hypothetical protein
MFKPKTTISGRLENSSGAQIRTEDLRVMSPTSCHCSTPHRVSCPFTERANYSTLPQARQAVFFGFVSPK